MRTEAYKKGDPFEPRVSFIPNLNPQDALKANKEAGVILEKGPLPTYSNSLQLAAALSLYNFDHMRERVSRSDKRTLRKRVIASIESLAEVEFAASQKGNILPTIGIEVEVPRIPLKLVEGIIIPAYATFFDTIGMPRNKINKDNLKTGGWEFSPRPSFSSQVQTRILSELIQGGFLPHLTQSHEQQQVQKYLDAALVSLHINLGIPSQLTPHPSLEKKTEALGIALAVAYSSPLRLRDRKSKSIEFAGVKGGDNIPLNKDRQRYGNFRVELKAMEVLDSKTYRAMHTAQTLFGIFFQAQIEKEGIYGYLNNALQSDIAGIFEKYKYQYSLATNPQDKSYEVYRLADRDGAAKETREVLERYTKLFRRMQAPATDSEALPQPQEA